MTAKGENAKGKARASAKANVDNWWRSQADSKSETSAEVTIKDDEVDGKVSEHLDANSNGKYAWGEAKGKAEAKSTPIDALAKMASDAGHDIDELAKRFNCLGAADMPEGVATTIERLLSTTGLCSAAQYAAASGAISGLLSRGLSASEAQQSLMRYGRVAHRKYLTAEGADAFVGWCDNNAE